MIVFVFAFVLFLFLFLFSICFLYLFLFSNKTVIRFGFLRYPKQSDRVRVRPRLLTPTLYLNLDYSGFHEKPHSITVYKRLSRLP